MNWSDIDRNPPKRVLAQFGLAAAALLVAFAFGRVHQNVVRWPLVAIALASALIAATRPALLRASYVAVATITFPLAFFVSRIVLAIMFYGVVTPIALVLRATGRDVLRRRRPNVDSYYLARTQFHDLKSYFRQF